MERRRYTGRERRQRWLLRGAVILWAMAVALLLCISARAVGPCGRWYFLGAGRAKAVTHWMPLPEPCHPLDAPAGAAEGGLTWRD